MQSWNESKCAYGEVLFADFIRLMCGRMAALCMR